MGAHIRAHDWSLSPLGPPETWPTPLLTIVGVMLAASQPMFAAWGPERAVLYNDPYAEILGAKHPAALGRPFFEVWHELRESVGPIVERAYAGEPTAMDDIALVMVRHGYPEEAHFSFFYAPLRDEGGAVAGVYCGCAEITDRVLAERRNALLLELGERLVDLVDAETIMAEATRLLGEHLRATRVGFADLSPDGAVARNAGEWLAPGAAGTAGEHALTRFGGGFAAHLAAGRTCAVADIRVDPRTAPGAPAYQALGIASLLVAPVVRGGRTAAALYVHTAAPRSWLAEDIELAEAVAARAWIAVERARAERALRESEAWLSGMFEQAPTFLALLHGPEHRFLRANPGYLRLVGGRPVLGLTVAEALPEVVEQGFVGILDRVYQTGEPYAAEGGRVLLQANPDVPAEERRLDFVFQPIRDAEGAVIGIFVEGADVTEGVRAMAALRESEARGRQTLDSATDYAIISTDLGGRVTRWNEGARRILGWDEKEMLGATLHRIFTPEDVTARRVDAEMRDALTTGRVAAEMLQLRRSGARFPASCALTLLRNDEGKPVGFVKVLQDRTEERRREGRLALLARASAGLLEAPDPDTVLGPLLEEGADLLGYDQAYVYSITPGEASDGACLSLTHSVGVDEDARAALASVPFSGPLCGVVAETGRPLILSHLLATTEPRYAPGRDAGLDTYAGYPVLADGRVAAVIAFGAAARPAFTAEELNLFATLARFLSVVRQRLGREASRERRIEERTAELREREAQLQQAQKMEAIGQLTGGLAHDVNNMLQGIGGALEMVGKRVEDGRLADVPLLLKAGRDGVERAAALTQGLLAFARRGHLDAKPIVVDDVVHGMADLVRRTVGPAIEMQLCLADGNWTVCLDQNRLESALLNLAINARDAMPEGGQLAFSTREASLGAADLGADAATVGPGDFVLVSVTDTGEGMPPDVLGRAFEPFFTTKPIGQGTGLGLSQIYGFVRQSGGFVRMASEVGRGTTVHLYFPRVTAAEAVAPASPSLETTAGETVGRIVLLAEDEHTVRTLAAEALRERGYVVLEAKDGPSALATLAGAGRVDLLVTDVGLPGLNGRQLADAARERRLALPVLFITGYAGTALDDALPSGMAVLAKPFSLDVLLARVAAMVAPASA
ncbi:PAS domain-containing protein [Sabulicella glaciei]|uniref:histidine kinase n=1 Tax=Sabulicella glaciei TaxID=2984948 RepID=A0ABT3NWM6_9PROT|nr:PAS domain-containing protein [Roseococcus sp. MDT2-1-1]MCW8086580.1 PAS domain-containing protein [Roseococcus sp. MDT2-1-1]